MNNSKCNLLDAPTCITDPAEVRSTKTNKEGEKCSSGKLDGTFPHRLRLFEISIWNKKALRKHLEWEAVFKKKKKMGDWPNLLYITFRADQSVFFLVGISSDFLLVRWATVMRINAPW